MSSNHKLSVQPHRTALALAAVAITSLLLAVAALLPASSLAGGGGCRGAGKAPDQLTAGEMRRATLCLVNRQRHRHGLGSVHSDRSLRKAATRHSADMVKRDYFSHYSPGGGSTQSRIGGSGYLAGARSFRYGEVIGGGTANGGSPKRVMKAWMHSGPHRAAILTGAFRDLGIGVAKGFPGAGSRGATFTIDFGSRN
jgi:uncharacterized protein YkwD